MAVLHQQNRCFTLLVDFQKLLSYKQNRDIDFTLSNVSIHSFIHSWFLRDVSCSEIQRSDRFWRFRKCWSEMLTACYSTNVLSPSAKCIGGLCIMCVYVCRVCVHLCGWVGIQYSTLQSSEGQMAAQSHLSCSTGLLSLAPGLYPVLAMASVIPTVPYSTHTLTHTFGSIQVPFTLQANQAAYSAITTNPAAASDLTRAGIQTNTLIAATGCWLSRFFH